MFFVERLRPGPAFAAAPTAAKTQAAQGHEHDDESQNDDHCQQAAILDEQTLPFLLVVSQVEIVVRVHGHETWKKSDNIQFLDLCSTF